MKKSRSIAFTVELLLLFVSLLFVIVVITKSFMASRGQSLAAKYLTEAVCLAEDVAEVTSSASGRDEAVAWLRELERVRSLKDTAERTEMEMQFAQDDRTGYHVVLDWETEPSAYGVFTAETISVYHGGGAEPLYTMRTGDYQAEDTE